MHTEPSDSPLRAAASVVMLRDGAAGMEVFLMKRHGLSDVLGGAHVFPGGKVDVEDASPGMQARLDAPAHALRLALDEPSLDELTAAALHVAALREAFEETGVLYARGADAAQAQAAKQMLREGHAFDEVLTRMSLQLEVSRLTPWSRWITPRVGAVIHNKRFDARFFLARMPAGQMARHANHEATESVWLTPRVALRQFQDGLIELAPPQIMSLVHLAHHDSVESVQAEARQRKPRVIQPEPFEHQGERAICFPGDPCHSVRERALPGPTRLAFRNHRFEAVGGFEALLS